jgi:hypothetical protein
MPPSFNLYKNEHGESEDSDAQSDGDESYDSMLENYSKISDTNGRIGIYNPSQRRALLARFAEKRNRRVWRKKVRYTCRKNLADNRVRVKGRFVKREELAA